jgi:hypothetical protein
MQYIATFLPSFGEHAMFDQQQIYGTVVFIHDHPDILKRRKNKNGVLFGGS